MIASEAATSDAEDEDMVPEVEESEGIAAVAGFICGKDGILKPGGKGSGKAAAGAQAVCGGNGSVSGVGTGVGTAAEIAT